MGRLSACLARATPWGLVALAVVFGGFAVVLFGYWALYFWFVIEPPSVPLGLLWFAVAVSVPIGAAFAQRYATRHGETREARMIRVSGTTLAVAFSTFMLVNVVSSEL